MLYRNKNLILTSLNTMRYFPVLIILLTAHFYSFSQGTAKAKVEAYRGKFWGSTPNELGQKDYWRTEYEANVLFEGYEDKKDPKTIEGVKIMHTVYFYRANKLCKVKVTLVDEKEGDAQVILGFLQSKYGAETSKLNMYTGTTQYKQTKYTFETKEGNYIEYYMNTWSDKSIFTEEFARINNPIRSYFVIYSPETREALSDW